MIPFVNLTGQREKYRFELENAERAVLDSGCYIGGAEVSALENELSAYSGVPHTLTCASGTDALTLALMTLQLQPGDEVIVPDFTFIAPAECCAFLGGTPVFADIDRETLQISPESVRTLIGKRTKGIIAVNLFGQCAPFKELRKIADEFGLWIIEDAAQAFGARVLDSTKGSPTSHNNKACAFGDISITSFYPSKPLGCYGDGGAVFTKDEALAQRARTIANHGSIGRYDHQIVGMNSRLDALQAAVLRVKLRHLDEELAVREQNAALYDRFFEEYNASAPKELQIVPQKIAEGNTSTYAQYTVLAENRDYFIQKLNAAGIPYCIHYPTPLHSQGCFGAPIAECETPLSANGNNAEWASRRVVSLPVCAFTNVSEIITKLRTN